MNDPSPPLVLVLVVLGCFAGMLIMLGADYGLSRFLEASNRDFMQCQVKEKEDGQVQRTSQPS